MIILEKCVDFDREYIDLVTESFGESTNCLANVAVEIRSGDYFTVKKCGNNAVITVYEKSQLFFAFTVLCANCHKDSFEYVKTTPHKVIDFMLDCSRSAVLNIATCKKLIVMLAKLGYNALELYTEDTYEIPSEPYFGHIRGRYTQKELKELDAYAKQYGIELIPCIQTLAHLDNIFLPIHRLWRT